MPKTPNKKSGMASMTAGQPAGNMKKPAPPKMLTRPAPANRKGTEKRMNNVRSADVKSFLQKYRQGMG